MTPLEALTLLAIAAVPSSPIPAETSGAAVVLQAFDAQSPYRPAPVRIGDRVHLVYELHLTNFASTPLSLDGLTVSDAVTGAPLATLAGDALSAAVGGISAGNGDPGVVIAPRMRAIVYLDIVLAEGTRPKSLGHRAAIRTSAGAISWVRSARRSASRSSTCTTSPPAARAS